MRGKAKELMASYKQTTSVLALVAFLMGCGSVPVANPADVVSGPPTTNVTSNGIVGEAVRDDYQIVAIPDDAPCKYRKVTKGCLRILKDDCVTFAHDAGVPWDAELENGAALGVVGEGGGETAGTYAGSLTKIGRGLKKVVGVNGIVGAGVGIVYDGAAYLNQWSVEQKYLINKCADRKGMNAGLITNIRGYIGPKDDDVLFLDPHHLTNGGTADGKPAPVADKAPTGFKNPNTTWHWGD